MVSPGIPPVVPVIAETLSWVGTVDTDWFNDANWLSRTPGPADTAIISDGSTAQINGQAASASVLYVGTGASGTLQILDVLNTTTAVLSNSLAATGTVTVTGSAGHWTNMGDLYLGNYGTGALTVETGGTVSTGTTYLGMAGLSDGTLTLTGTSTFQNTGTLFVGYGGTGTLQIYTGADATSDSAIIADGNGSDGSAIITGAGSTWTVTNGLTVGGGGIGSMEIHTGGVVSNGTGAIGQTTGAASSYVTLTGSGTQWNNSGELYVGVNGTADLSVYSGATVSSAGGIIGRHAQGTATLGGAGSQWTSGALTVGGDRTDATGAAGDGALIINTGAQVLSTDGRVADTATAIGGVSVDGSGSLWQLTGGLSVGTFGSGILEITGGGVVESASGLIGHEAGSNGAVGIFGSGSRWTNTGNVAVGNVGDATLDIGAGGVLQSLDGYVGSEDGSTAIAYVDGAGSTWTNSGDLFVGHNDGALGVLVVSAGGGVSNRHGILGDLAGSSGVAGIIGDGSLWATAGDLNIGRLGIGQLFVLDGGDVTSNRSLIANNTGSAGVAIVQGNGSTWNTTGNLYVGGDGDGTLIVVDGGSVSADTITIADGAMSTGALYIGASTGTAAGLGTLTTNAINFGSGNGSLVFNFGGPTYTLAAPISGTGAIDVLDGNVVLTGNSSAFLGTTTVSGGSLSVNGTLGGGLSVLGSGTLKGSGTVGALTIGSGGSVAPGNSVGTLNVAGNVTFDPGSTYKVEVNPAAGTSDLLHATGTATLNGGSVLHLGMTGGYKDNATYTILRADGGVSGAFASVGSSFAFIDPLLGYTATDVTLSLTRNTTSFGSIGQSFNQQSVGAAVESLGSGNAVYDAVIGLDTDEARHAFESLAGDYHTSTSGRMFDTSRFVSGIGTDRIRTQFGGIGAGAANSAPQGTALGYAESDQKVQSSAVLATNAILVDPETERATAWGNVYGGWGRSDGDSNARGMSSQTGGFVSGIDAAVIDTWRLGMLAGYSRSSFDRNGGGASGDSDDYSVGLYAGNQWGPLGLRTGVFYTYSDVSTRRSVEFAGFSEQLAGAYNAATTQVFGELGYELDVGQLRFEPFANLAYVNLHTDGFTETGGASALRNSATDKGIAYSTIGMRAATDVTIADITAKLNGTLGWRHAIGDTQTISTHSFSVGDSFTSIGTPITRDSLVLETGFDVPISRSASVGLSYNGQYGGSGISQTLKAKVAASF